jgi:hypothetical protein
MPPTLVVCKCDPRKATYAVCDRCKAEKEIAELHRMLVERGAVQK